MPIVRSAVSEEGFTSRVYPPFVAAPMSKSPTAVAVIPLIRKLSLLTCNVILSSFTCRVFPDLERASPAVICPAPENCTKVRLVVSRVIVSFVVSTKPLSPFTVPSSTKQNIPAVTSAEVFASSERAGVAATT